MTLSIPAGLILLPAAGRKACGILLYGGKLMTSRVICYVDGFNLYHAIDEMTGLLKQPCNHLKWVDLWKLTEQFIDHNFHKVEAVHWFSAIKDGKPARALRHEAYQAALESVGVKPQMAHFKQKHARCRNCSQHFITHEEKESDVNLAVQLIADAYEGRFDQAFVISRDSDLTSPLRFIRKRFPDKKLKVIAPPERKHSKELWAIATHRATIQKQHLEACLLPQQITKADGTLICTRDARYDPPA